jgi:MFS family permease
MSSPTAITFRYEALRAVSSGIVETASSTFLLIIAVRWFQAGAFAKGCVAAGSGLGYLLGPAVVSIVGRLRIPSTQGAARLAATGGVAIAVAAAVPILPVFTIASLIGMATAGALIPLLTQVYQDNYPPDSRGRLFSRTVMIRIVAAATFSLAAGSLLAADITWFRALLVIFAFALLFAAWCLARIPSVPLATTGSGHPLRMFLAVRDDRIFRATLVSWMFMGFANLMMLPLRVEYLANPRYGLVLRPDMIAVLTGVVPNVARLVMSPIWGRLFDRANFFVLRMVLNLGFALGIVSFFTSDSTMGLVVAAITFGVSTAGGDVAWSLWVTKIAPPARVAEYMSVHTFFTGLRGLVAPMIGFALVERYSMVAMGWLSAACILVATLMLLPEAKRGNLVRPRAAPASPPIPADEGEP